LSTICLHPSYFPTIAQMVAIVQSDNIYLEQEDNYQKQTYRNRCYIAQANGKLLLNIPIKHTKDGVRQKTKNIQVEKSFPWVKQHWKSIQNAYRTSPFFEYYEDDLAPLFNPELISSLNQFNITLLNWCLDSIDCSKNILLTTEYKDELTDIKDLRFLINAKKEPHFNFNPYHQVFGEKHGFLSNLSFIDLLFNEGPSALDYLESQSLPT